MKALFPRTSFESSGVREQTAHPDDSGILERFHFGQADLSVLSGQVLQFKRCFFIKIDIEPLRVSRIFGQIQSENLCRNLRIKGLFYIVGDLGASGKDQERNSQSNDFLHLVMGLKSPAKKSGSQADSI